MFPASPWSVYPYMVAISSYYEPVAVPSSDPATGPFVCAPIPIVWLPYVLGALTQLRMPIAWQVTTDAEISDIMGQVDALIGNIATASMCEERGTVSMTILAGDSDAMVLVTFPTAFTATPVIVVSCDDAALIASWTTPDSTSFFAVITSATPALADMSTTLSWMAGPAS